MKKLDTLCVKDQLGDQFILYVIRHNLSKYL